MLAVIKNSVAYGHEPVGISALNLNAVYIRLNGGSVDTGKVALIHIVINRGAEGHLIAAYGLVVKNRCVCHTLNSVSDIGEHGCLTVINCRGIVNGYVIDIESEFRGDVAVFGGYVIVCGAVTVGNIKLHHGAVGRPADSRICRGVNVEVMPAGLVKAVHNARAAGTGIHIVTVDSAAGKDWSTVGIVACDGSESPTDPQTYPLIGNIYPRTNTYGILEHPGLGSVNTRLHIAGLERVAVVYICAECKGTAVHLAVFAVHNLLSYLGPYVVVLSAGSLVNVYVLVGTVLKVVNHFRTLTEGKLGGCNNGLVINECGSKVAAGYCCVLLAGGKAEAVYSTHCGVVKYKVKVRCLYYNVLGTVGSNKLKLYGLAVRNDHFRA